MAASQQFGGYGAALGDEAGLPSHEILPPAVGHVSHDHDATDVKAMADSDEKARSLKSGEKQDVTEQLMRESEEDGFDYLVSEEDRAKLRRVPAAMPWTAYMIAICELAERFSYYGTTQVFQNMIDNPLPPGSTTGSNSAPNGVPGIYGRGQQTATGLTTFNTFWVYINPLIGGWLADTYLGRFNTICLGVAITLVGHLLFIIATIPSVISDKNGSFACFILGVIINGVGTGFFKSTVSVLIAEQIKAKRQYVKTIEKTGERVLVDPTVTAARLYDFFYLAINVGAIGGQVAMPFAEKYVGYWLAMLLPTCIFLICVPVLFFARNRYVKVPPAGSVLSNALRLAWLAVKPRFSWNPARFYRNLRSDNLWEDVKPSRLGVNRPKWMTFDDNWVEEVRRGYKACYVFLLFPFYWLCYNQISGNLISQGATMTLNGVPNEIPQNFDPLSIIIFVPTFEFLVYPGLRRMGIKFTALKKIFAGFLTASLGMVWAAVLQHYIYETSPCGDMASGDDCEPSPLSVWIQVGPYGLIGLSEIFASVTSLEYAYTKAPKNMRSLVMGVGLFTTAIGAAIQEAFLPLVKDPLLVWMYTTFACIAFVAGCLFAVMYRHIDAEEDYLNNLASSNYNDARKVHNGIPEEWDMHRSGSGSGSGSGNGDIVKS